MIKFRITDDEFNNYKEDFVVKEFQQFDAIESFRPQETATPPQESINIQEDTAIGQRQNLYTNRHKEFNNNDFNKNTSNSSQSDGSMNNSSSSNTSDVSSTSGTSSSSSSTSSSATSSGSSSGANVSGGEGLTAASSSTAAATGSTAAASGAAATTTAASVAGTLTVAAAAIVSIVVIAANIIKTAPTIFMNYFLVGTNYISFLLNIDNLDPETEYELSVTNPLFDVSYNLRDLRNSDGLYEGYITGLTPHRYYTLTISSISSDSDVPIPHFNYEFITKDEEINPVYKATYDLSYETSVGTNDTCYQYVYTMNTKFDNSAQSSDSYELQLVAGDGTVLDRYEGTSSTASLACNYDQTSVDVYLVPITTINGKKYTFDKQKLTTISNPSLVGESTLTLRPNNTFRLDNYEAPLLTDVGTDFVCKCFIGSAATPVTQTFKDDMVAITGNSSGVDSITLQIQDTAGKIAGQQTISLQETTTQEIIFYATGNYTLTDGYTITTNITDAPTFGDNEGYRLIVTNDDKSVFFGMGDRSTATTNNYTVPDLSYDFYRACLAPYRIVGNVEYVFENAAAENTDGCEHLFQALDTGVISFNKEYGAETISAAISSEVQEIGMLATITNYYNNSSPTSFTMSASAGLAEQSDETEISLAQWNDLVRTEIVITDPDGVVVLQRFTYTKPETLLTQSNPTVVNKKLKYDLALDSSLQGLDISYLTFKDTSNSGAMISDPISRDAQVGNDDNWYVLFDSVLDKTITGTWAYSYSDSGFDVVVEGYDSYTTTLTITPYVDYAVPSSHNEGEDFTIYVDGYPTYNGQPINLDNWALKFYSANDGGATALSLSTSYDYIGATTNNSYSLVTMTVPGLDAMSSNPAQYFYYEMTYGSSNTSMTDGFVELPLPTVEYDYSDVGNDSASYVMTYPIHAMTYNVVANTVESVNVYDEYTINAYDTDIYYVSRVAYTTDGLHYDINSATFDADHPYAAIEDIPYSSSGYNYQLVSYANKTIGEQSFKVFLTDMIANNNTIGASINSEGHTALRGANDVHRAVDGSNHNYVLYVNLDYLASGESVILHINGQDIPIDPSVARSYDSYVETELDNGTTDELGIFTIYLTNMIYENGDATVLFNFTTDKTDIDLSTCSVSIKNRIRTGATELSAYGITVKGIALANEGEQYLYSTVQDVNGNTLTGDTYFVAGDTATLHTADNETVLVTIFSFRDV